MSDDWTELCRKAIARHRLCNPIPAFWPMHEAAIVAVYGRATYNRAIGAVETPSGPADYVDLPDGTRISSSTPRPRPL